MLIKFPYHISFCLLAIVMLNIFMYYTPPKFLSCKTQQHFNWEHVHSKPEWKTVHGVPDQMASLDLDLQGFQKR